MGRRLISWPLPPKEGMRGSPAASDIGVLIGCNDALAGIHRIHGATAKGAGSHSWAPYARTRQGSLDKKV